MADRLLGEYKKKEAKAAGYSKPAAYTHKDAFYSTQRWQRLRKMMISQNPICWLCKLHISEHVDHLDNDTNHNAPHNLLCLCKSCHSWKTCRFDRPPAICLKHVNCLDDFVAIGYRWNLPSKPPMPAIEDDSGYPDALVNLVWYKLYWPDAMVNSEYRNKITSKPLPYYKSVLRLATLRFVYDHDHKPQR